MIKVMDILLEDTDDNAIYKILDEQFNKRNSPYNIFLWSLSPGYPNYRTVGGFLNKYAKGWEVQLKRDDSIVGKIIKDVISNKALISFTLDKITYRQELIALANSFVSEIKFLNAKVVNKRVYTANGKLQGDEKINPPKNPNKLKIHQDAWKIIQSMKKESLSAYNNSDVDVIEKNTLGDYRDRVNHELKISYSEKTISRIIEEGEAGVLD